MDQNVYRIAERNDRKSDGEPFVRSEKAGLCQVEKEEKTVLSDKKVLNKGINTLNFTVKNGLINLVINHQTHFKIERSLTEMKKGAFGVVCDGNSKCLLFGCKLESI